MSLFLVRHGNTFGPGDRVVWVGSNLDLELTPEGEEQARALGRHLSQLELTDPVIFSSPLQRTYKTARLIAGELGIAPESIVVDQRLNEIDYGAWSGKSNQELSDGGFGREVENWNSGSVWPTNAGWLPTEEQLKDGVSQFAQYVAKEFLDKARTVIAVSSNGRLRYFLGLIDSEWKGRRNFKIRTGHFSVLERSPSTWSCKCWNCPPG